MDAVADDDPLASRLDAPGAIDGSPAHDSAPPDQTSSLSCTRGGLRSALYPDDWQPGFKDEQGRFLHDFSYAGYRHGEAPLPEGAFAAVLDVTVPPYGADATGKTDATAAIQKAIDNASRQGGGIVYLPSGNYRVAKLRVRASNVVLRGAGSQGDQSTRLHFPDDGAKPSILFEGAVTGGKKRTLAKDAQIFDTDVALTDISGLSVGDHIALTQTITQAFIEQHNMQGIWDALTGKEKPFFRRQITAIDDASKRVSFTVPLRYPLTLRDSAGVRTAAGALEECGIEHLALSNPADTMETAWAAKGWAALKLEDVSDCWVHNVRSFESPKTFPDGWRYHLRSHGLVLHNAKRVTVRDVHFGRPQNSGGAGNGYLFMLQRSSEVLVEDCTGRHGRHHFSTAVEFGSSGNVFLRVHGSDSVSYKDWQHYLEFLAGTKDPWTSQPSDFHMHLAVANLVDNSVLDDGWMTINRRTQSANSGMTGTQNVFWNNRGAGKLTSYQYGWGYVIGTQKLDVRTAEGRAPGKGDEGTEPYDYTEHLGAQPSVVSLYEDQLARRLGACP